MNSSILGLLLSRMGLGESLKAQAFLVHGATSGLFMGVEISSKSQTIHKEIDYSSNCRRQRYMILARCLVWKGSRIECAEAVNSIQLSDDARVSEAISSKSWYSVIMDIESGEIKERICTAEIMI